MPILALRLLGKFAVTVVFEDSVRVQSAVPVQPPLQPENVKPASAVARNDTALPATKLKEQVVPQLIPAGVLVTVPLPVFETVRLTRFRVNDAVQVLFASMVTEPLAQSPVHDLNL